MDSVTPLGDRVHYDETKMEAVVEITSVAGGVIALRTTQGLEVLDRGLLALCSGDHTHQKHGDRIERTPSRHETEVQLVNNPCGLEPFGCAVYVQVEFVGSLLSGDEPFLPLPPFVADLKR